MRHILPIPAFQDNYIWLIRQGQHAVVVDPGDAGPVLDYLQQHDLQLGAILITHHHADHIGGVAALLRHGQVPVYAPRKERYDFAHQAVAEGDQLILPGVALSLQVLEVPGHTLGHVAYYGANYLFCGDTLFSAGCGRLFEGTPQQMYASLQRLASLPAHTEVYCTHEYTAHNLQFALGLEPHNPQLLQRVAQVRQLRQRGQPSLPSSIAVELATNPFLRCDSAAIRHASGVADGDAVHVFSAIREMRNHF